MEQQAKKIKFIAFLLFVLLFLTGCSGPSTHEIARIALFNTFYIYLISLLTLFVYLFIVFKDKFSFSKFTTFAENFIKKTFIKFLAILIIIYTCNIIISLLQISKYTTNINIENLITQVITAINPITLFIVIITTTIPVVLYTIVLIFLAKIYYEKTVLINRYYWIPSIITVLYCLSFLFVFIMDYYFDINKGMVIAIWTWPFSFIH